MSRTSIIILFAGIIIALIIAIFLKSDFTPKTPLSPPVTPTTSPSPLPTKTEFSFYQCQEDSDCIIVKADACGCTAGGKATAINRNYQTEWNSKFPQLVCPQVISNHWTCAKSIPKCINNQCQLVEAKN